MRLENRKEKLHKSERKNTHQYDEVAGVIRCLEEEEEEEEEEMMLKSYTLVFVGNEEGECLPFCEGTSHRPKHC